MIAEDLLTKIGNRLDMIEVVGEYTHLTGRGDRYKGLCPLHRERTPSFNVTPSRQLFYCFGCQTGGSLFTFVMLVESITFREAVQMLAERAGIEFSETWKEEEEGGRPTTKEVLYELYRRVTSAFRFILHQRPEGKEALSYLEGRRVSSEVAETFQLGLAPEDRGWLYKQLLRKGYSKEILVNSGLFLKEKQELCLFAHRIMFPLVDTHGRVVGFSGRALDGKTRAKYINSPETELYRKREMLFGLNESANKIRKEREFCLCEGNVDVLALFQAGIAAVSPLGSSFTEKQARVMRRYADKCVVMYDGDEAGQEGAMKAVKLCEQHELHAVIAPLPPGKDPAELLRDEGEEALEARVHKSVSPFDYLLNQLARRHDLHSPEGLEAAVVSFFPYVEGVVSEVRREALLGRLSREVGLGKEAILREYSKRRARGGKEKDEARATRQKKVVGEDLYLMLALWANPTIFHQASRRFERSDLVDKEARRLFDILIQSRRDTVSLHSLLEKWENPDLEHLFLQKVASGEFSYNSERVIVEMIQRIKVKNLIVKGQAIARRLEVLERKGKDEAANELIREKIRIDGEVERLKVNGERRFVD